MLNFLIENIDQISKNTIWVYDFELVWNFLRCSLRDIWHFSIGPDEQWITRICIKPNVVEHC